MHREEDLEIGSVGKASQDWMLRLVLFCFFPSSLCLWPHWDVANEMSRASPHAC